MATIELRNGFTCEVDDSDLDSLSQWKWTASGLSEKFSISTRYAYHDVFSRTERGKYRRVYMHRFILDPSEDSLVDHRDGNGLNNKRSNLRICSYSENNRNRVKRRPLSSRFKGVSIYSRTNNLWVAHIRNGGDQIKLGVFDNELDAALAYNRAALKFHGEFCKLNQI